MGRVLLVDDEEDILMMCRLTLTRAGHDVMQATTGEEALAVLHSRPVDTVLLDIRLPGLDGWEFLQRVRADPNLQQLKIVMMSAHTSPSTMLRATDLGSDFYITKPFALEELVRVVAGTLEP